MTALLTDAELDFARRLAQAKPKLIGTLASGEDVYFNGKYSVEKDHFNLVEPTGEELAEIHRIIRQDKTDALAPARGIATIMLVGLACWLALGLVIYFTFFEEVRDGADIDFRQAAAGQSLQARLPMLPDLSPAYSLQPRDEC